MRTINQTSCFSSIYLVEYVLKEESPISLKYSSPLTLWKPLKYEKTVQENQKVHFIFIPTRISTKPPKRKSTINRGTLHSHFSYSIKLFC